VAKPAVEAMSLAGGRQLPDQPLGSGLRLLPAPLLHGVARLCKHCKFLGISELLAQGLGEPCRCCSTELLQCGGCPELMLWGCPPWSGRLANLLGVL
jgi:hypothetical protein